MEVFYEMEDFETVALKTSQKLGAVWKNNQYRVPDILGRGIVEAYNFEHLSVMLSKFWMHETIRVGRLPSRMDDYFVMDCMVQGASDFFVDDLAYQNRPVPQLVYGSYIASPITESYGDFKGQVDHVHLSILVRKSWLEDFLEQALPPLLQDPSLPLFIFQSIQADLVPTLALLVKSTENSRFRKHFLYAKSLEVITYIVEAIFDREPEKPSHSYHPDDVHRVTQIANYLQEQLLNPPTTEQLVQQFHINRDKLQSIFKSVYGKTLSEYTRYIRMERAHHLLLTRKNVAEVGYELGYSNLSHFSRAFKKVHGINPSDLLRPRLRPENGEEKDP